MSGSIGCNTERPSCGIEGPRFDSHAKQEFLTWGAGLSHYLGNVNAPVELLIPGLR